MRIIRKKMKSGLRIIAAPLKDNLTVTVLVMVEAGSKYERPDESGLSHFLEHMCFKGTINRPTSLDISHELDSLGAENNAFTSFEYTGYYAKANPKHTDKLIEIISDLYLNPVFPEKEIEKEKGVIIEEMNMYEDLPQRKAQEVFLNLLYGTQPAGQTILGDRKVIKNAKRKDFMNYRKKHYVPSSTLVVVAGDINPRSVINSVEKHFEALEDGRKSGKARVKEKQARPQIKLHHKKTDQTHVVLGMRTFGARDKRNPALWVLSTILGEGMSSRLFQKLREEMGVCYYVRSSVEEFTDHGYLSVSAGVDKRRAVRAVEAIVGELRRLRDEAITPSELEKAKEYIVSHLYMGLESSDSVAVFVADQEIIKGRIRYPKDIEKAIRKVTVEEVRKIANEIITDKRLNLAIVGNVKKVAPLSAVLKIN